DPHARRSLAALPGPRHRHPPAGSRDQVGRQRPLRTSGWHELRGPARGGAPQRRPRHQHPACGRSGLLLRLPRRLRPLTTPLPQCSERRALLALSWPRIVTQVGSMMLGVVDTVMVGGVSVEAIDAATLGNVWIHGTMLVAMGIVLGIDPLAARAHGAGDAARL